MAFIVCGSQQPLVKKQIKSCILQQVKDVDNCEIIRLDSNKINENDLLDECEQYSLCFNKKVIILENCGFLTGEKSEAKFSYSDKLIKYLANENPNTILIFSVIYDKKLDSRTKIYKILSTKDCIIMCKELTAKEWPKQVELYFKKKHVLIEDSAIEEICKRCDGNFNIFLNESKKLLLYKKDQILLDDVKKIFTKPLYNNVFEIQNNLLHNNKEKAIQIFRDLEISKNIEPVVLISIFANQLISLDKYLYLYKKGFSYGEIATQLGENPYVVMKNINNFRNIKSELIEKVLDKLYLLDKEIKHGEINKSYGFELFLINF